MKNAISDHADHVRVTFEGDIDLECSEEVRQVLLGVVGRSALTVVDLSAVTAIDCSGVAGSLDGHLTAQKRGNQLTLVAPSDPVMRVLRLAPLDKVFVFQERPDERG